MYHRRVPLHASKSNQITSKLITTNSWQGHSIQTHARHTWCLAGLFFGLAGLMCVAMAVRQSALELASAPAAVSAASPAACVQHQNLALLLLVPRPAAAIVIIIMLPIKP
jgi:hypothetical protein